jgi:outer membrane protein TolC
MIRAAARIVALILAASGIARAQNTPQPPPAATGPAVSLDEAVRTTLDRSPKLALQTQTIETLAGQLRETSGTFDTVFRASPTAGFQQQALSPGLQQSAKGLRDTLKNIQDNYTQLTGVLQIIIRNQQIVPPRCPASGTTFTFGSRQFSNAFLQNPINVDRIDTSERTLLGTNTFLNGTALGDLLGGISASAICTDPNIIQLAPQNFFDFFRRVGATGAIDQSGGQGLQAFLRGVNQIEPENRLLQLQITSAVAARARLALQRLGPVPIDDITFTSGLDVSAFKPFRNGWSFTADANIQSQERNYRDKPIDPAFGGLGQPPQFFTQIQFTLNAPLGRGFGTTQIAAPERSARLVLASERENLRHNATEEAFRTTLAYLNVIAARDTLAAYQDSLTRQNRIIQLTDQAVQIGDIARVETDRARARASTVQSAINAARASLTQNRISLAEAMGLDPDRLDATPLPAESYASATAAVPDANTLIAQALALRRDVRARARRLEATEILAAGARAGMKRRYDFNVNAGISNLYDTPVYRFLPDEQGTIIPPSTPPRAAIRFYSPSGYYNAIIGRYEPFVVAQFQFQFPFKNSSARGRFQQAEANMTSTRVDAVDLTRSIRDNVVDLTDQIRQSAAAIERWQAAVRADDQALQGVLQRFEIREVKLIDTLLTEEAATQDRLQLISQWQKYFSALARLKFETGELLTFGSEGPSISDFKFDSSFLVVR